MLKDYSPRGCTEPALGPTRFPPATGLALRGTARILAAMRTLWFIPAEHRPTVAPPRQSAEVRGTLVPAWAMRQGNDAPVTIYLSSLGEVARVLMQAHHTGRRS